MREDRPDGSILLSAGEPLGDVARSVGLWLDFWAESAPERVFLAERSGNGWRTVTYSEALQQVRALGAALLGRGLTAETPILILSGNSIDHGLLALAAQYVGVPVVPLAEQYSLIPAAHGRLIETVEMVRPALVFSSDGNQYGPALALDALATIETVATSPGSSKSTPFTNLLAGDRADVDAAHADVGPDAIAKILMTSGSTSAPKGVLTTHGMLCANQAQVAAGLPFLREYPARIVDWLPWNHTFGGSHNFNMMLANGGSLYIDDGKPLKGMFDRSIENLRLVTGTMLFNVPVGYQMLLSAMQADAGLRRHIFENLDMVFYAGASLPSEVWTGLEEMATEVRGQVPLMTSSWGLTETAPAVLLQQEPGSVSGRIGVPLPGATVKLVPQDDHRFEVRVKGPNVTPGYFNAPDKTAEAFDEEGFFRSGDAMSFVNPADMNAGLRFEGRLSDDFKLTTGTWVRATALRAEVLGCLSPLAADIVITGQDRADVGLLIVPNREAIAALGYSDAGKDGAMTCPLLAADLAVRLTGRRATGTSTRITRALVLGDPPSLAAGEMTAKGNLNNRKILETRAGLVARLYDANDPAIIKI